MSESSYLGGKVLKKTLPVFEKPPADAPILKRLMLAQGELAQVHDSEAPIHYLAHLELREGTVRGNHYHETKEELVYVIQGELRLVIEDVDSTARDSLTLQPGDIAIIRTRIAHAFQVLKPGHAIEFSSARFDPADIHRRALI